MNAQSTRSLLEQLYPEYNTKHLIRKIERIMKKQKRTSLRRHRWSEQETFLITYGDSLIPEQGSPLSALDSFLDRHLRGVFSHIHLLPFYPWSSDDGFAVVDYEAVAPEIGNWEEVQQLSRKSALMFDGVINHISSKSAWVREFLEENPDFADFFIRAEEDLQWKDVVRPRALPLFHRYEGKNGPVSLWTTFSDDQIDLNYKNPEVLFRILELILFYRSRGARVLRLDAIGFLWKKPNTSCIHLEETHLVIRLIRNLLDRIDPDFTLITETNVPHRDNISYWGNGSDEAGMVYQFPLPPLMVHSLQTGDESAFCRWADRLEVPPGSPGFFNFLASHDGIGLNPVQEILTEEEINRMIETVEASGGRISWKSNPDGTESPYEMNISYYDALSAPGDPEEIKIRRFILAHALMFALTGVPAVYIHSILGSTSDHRGMEDSGINRRINREKMDLPSLEAQLSTPGSRRESIMINLSRLIVIRRSEPVFGPSAEQRVRGEKGIVEIRRTIDLPEEELLSRREGTLWAFYNLTGEIRHLELPSEAAGGRNLLENGPPLETSSPLQIEPYGFRWIYANTKTHGYNPQEKE